MSKILIPLHGLGHRMAWETMKAKCRQKSHKDYAQNGGRGLRVCDRWLGPNGYANFAADMGKRPHGYVLSRKDRDLDFTPENCEWITVTQKISRRIRHGRPEDPNSFAAKCRAHRIHYNVAWQRIHTFGWTEEQALTTPVRVTHRMRKWNARPKKS